MSWVYLCCQRAFPIRRKNNVTASDDALLNVLVHSTVDCRIRGEPVGRREVLERRARQPCGVAGLPLEVLCGCHSLF